MKIKVGLVDDQQLFLKSLGSLINSFKSFEVVVDGLNGEDIIKALSIEQNRPELMLIDVDMPIMDGITTVKYIAEQYPLIRMVALSLKDDDRTIIQMIRSGCCAYLAKDIHPTELEKALEEVYLKGHYNADIYNINFRRLLNYGEDHNSSCISKKEMIFLQLACSDLTYNQIARKMNLAERTIDGYRESMFEKLHVKSRVGMALEAIKRKLVQLS